MEEILVFSFKISLKPATGHSQEMFFEVPSAIRVCGSKQTQHQRGVRQIAGVCVTRQHF